MAQTIGTARNYTGTFIFDPAVSAGIPVVVSQFVTDEGAIQFADTQISEQIRLSNGDTLVNLTFPIEPVTFVLGGGADDAKRIDSAMRAAYSLGKIGNVSATFGPIGNTICLGSEGAIQQIGKLMSMSGDGVIESYRFILTFGSLKFVSL